MKTTVQTSAVLVMGGIRNYMAKLKSLVQFREKCLFMPVAPLSTFCKENSMLLEKDEKPSVQTESIHISWPSDEKE
jgi:hypothetical protein